jgi:hypothetical protein
MFRPNYVSSHRRLLVLFVFLLRTAVTDSEKGHPQCAPRYTQQREAERERETRAAAAEAFPLGQKHSEPPAHQQEIEK